MVGKQWKLPDRLEEKGNGATTLLTLTSWWPKPRREQWKQRGFINIVGLSSPYSYGMKCFIWPLTEKWSNPWNVEMSLSDTQVVLLKCLLVEERSVCMYMHGQLYSHQAAQGSFSGLFIYFMAGCLLYKRKSWFMLVWKLIVLPVGEANLRYTRIIKQEICRIQKYGYIFLNEMFAC